MLQNGIPKLLALLFLVTPATVEADQYGDFTYSTDGTNVTITGYTGLGGVVTIPEMISNTPVTGIGNYAFQLRASLTGVEIPHCLRNIGKSAFGGCTNLSNILIPDGVVSIEDSAFGGCRSLTNIVIGNGVTNIGSTAFAECVSLFSIKIPDTVTSLGMATFKNCRSLTAISMPNHITDIQGITFMACISLTSLEIPGGVTNIGNYAFMYCTNLATVYFHGNAPRLGGSSVFFDDDKAIVYYLPGTIGWPDFAAQTEVPVVLWNPQVQTSDSSFGVRSNGFGFNIAVTTNTPIVIEAATNLTGGPWTVLQSCTLTSGSVYFSDPASSNYPARFYRIRSP